MSSVKLASISGANFFAPATLVFVYSSSTADLSALPSAADAGDMTAGVWKRVAEVSGSGWVRFAAARLASSSAASLSARLVIDGAVVCTMTVVSAGSQPNRVVLLAGAGVTPAHHLHNIPFASAAALEIMSSIDRSAGSSAQYSFIHALSNGVVYNDPLAAKSTKRRISAGLYFNEAVKMSASSSFAPDLSGALTADVYKTVVDIAGAGVINSVAVRHNTSSSCNCSIRVTLDGVVVAEGTTDTATSSSAAIVVIGGQGSAASNGPQASAFAAFRNSLKVEVACSINRSSGTSAQYAISGYLT